MSHLFQFLHDDEAATAVEYAVMLALILVSIMAAISSVGTQTNGMWENNVSELKKVNFIQ
jgi:pilus assembly protein Flp/PilA